VCIDVLYGDVLSWRRFVEETFCQGDFLSRRRFVCVPFYRLGASAKFYLTFIHLLLPYMIE
jgi:hypothetical protein